MIFIFLKKYKKFGWNVNRLKRKQKKLINNINYDLNKLMILNWILGRLNVEGHKSWSFFILTNVLLSLKKMRRKKKPIIFLIFLLQRIKQNVLLFNKRKGSLVFELPRFLTIEQSIKKIIEWLIKASKKNKKNIIESLKKEIFHIFHKRGEIFKKKQYITDTIAKNKPFFYLLKKKKRR